MINKGINIAAKGMQSLIDLNDTIANNLANVNTAGFKKSTLTFRNIYDAKIEQTSPPGEDFKTANHRYLGKISMGSATDRSIIQFTQGTLERTGNPLDLAIEGDGFFKVMNSDGNVAYTRNGNCTIDSRNYLVTLDGEYILDPRDMPIRIDLNDLQATRDQIVFGEKGEVIINNPNAPQMLQTIAIYDFLDKTDVVSLGNSKFIPGDLQENRPVIAQKYSIQQGAIEASNTNTITEMINSIQVSRCYETLSTLVRENSSLLDTAINLGRLRI